MYLTDLTSSRVTFQNSPTKHVPSPVSPCFIMFHYLLFAKTQPNAAKLRKSRVLSSGSKLPQLRSMSSPSFLDGETKKVATDLWWFVSSVAGSSWIISIYLSIYLSSYLSYLIFSYLILSYLSMLDETINLLNEFIHIYIHTHVYTHNSRTQIQWPCPNFQMPDSPISSIAVDLRVPPALLKAALAPMFLYIF